MARKQRTAKKTTEQTGDSSGAGVSAYAGNMTDSTNVGPANPADNMRKDFKPTTEVAAETPGTDHQTINIKGYNFNLPPPSPRNKCQQDTGGKSGKGFSQSGGHTEKGAWQPTLTSTEVPDLHAHDESRAQHRFSSTGAHGKGGKKKGKNKSKGGESPGPKDKENPLDLAGDMTRDMVGAGKARQAIHSRTHEHPDGAWRDLKYWFPDHYNPSLTEF